jgi:hypothetical protein
VILRGTVQAGRIVVEGALTLQDGDEVMIVVREPGVAAAQPTGASLWPAIAETLRLAERLGDELRAAAEPPPLLAILPAERRPARGVVRAAATGRR